MMVLKMAKDATRLAMETKLDGAVLAEQQPQHQFVSVFAETESFRDSKLVMTDQITTWVVTQPAQVLQLGLHALEGLQ